MSTNDYYRSRLTRQQAITAEMAGSLAVLYVTQSSVYPSFKKWLEEWEKSEHDKLINGYYLCVTDNLHDVFVRYSDYRKAIRWLDEIN